MFWIFIFCRICNRDEQLHIILMTSKPYNIILHLMTCKCSLILTHFEHSNYPDIPRSRYCPSRFIDDAWRSIYSVLRKIKNQMLRGYLLVCAAIKNLDQSSSFSFTIWFLAGFFSILYIWGSLISKFRFFLLSISSGSKHST